MIQEITRVLMVVAALPFLAAGCLFQFAVEAFEVGRGVCDDILEALYGE